MAHYKTAQICLNGHMVTSMLEDNPEMSSKHCSECGVVTISSCPDCSSRIRGFYYVEGFITTQPTPVRAYCHYCGRPYPWTLNKLDAARVLADELEGLSSEDRELLKETFDDLVVETPKTEVAASRFREVLAKTVDVGGKSIERIIVSVASEAVKKLLMP